MFKLIASPRLFTLWRVILGGVDGLSYPLALVASGPLLVYMSSDLAYAKVACVLLLSSVGSLFNLSGPHAVIQVLSRPGLSSRQVSTIIAASISVTLMGALVFACLLAMFLPLTGIVDMFIHDEIPKALMVGWVLAATVSVDGTLGAVLKARGLLGGSASVELWKSCMILALPRIIGHSQWWMYIEIIACTSIVSALVKCALLIRARVLTNPDWARITKGMHEVTRVGGWQWAMILSAFFYQQADRLFIASHLSAKDFATYTFCWQAAIFVHSSCAASLIFMLPEATSLVSSMSATELKKKYTEHVRLGALVATALGGIAALVAFFLFRSKLLPNPLRGGLPIFSVMLVSTYMAALSVVPYYYCVALGKLSMVSFTTVVASILAFATALVAVDQLGILGLAMTKFWGISTLLCFIWSASAISHLRERVSPDLYQIVEGFRSTPVSKAVQSANSGKTT